MKFEEIEKLIRLVAETKVDEVEVRRQGVEVRVRRRLAEGEAAPVQVLPVAGAPAAGAAPAAAPWPAQDGALAAAKDSGDRDEREGAKADDDEEGLHVVTAAMVGTFYRRANPESEPLVNEGDVVKKGQVLFILEAMKIFNEIESEVSGTVVRVFADDGQPVEYGEKLLAIRPV